MRISDCSSDVCSSDLDWARLFMVFLLQASLDAERMGGKPLGARERDGGGADRGEARLVEREEAGALHKVGDRQPARETRAASGGKDMVRPRDIIADSLGRLAAEADRSGMAHLGEQRVGLGGIDRSEGTRLNSSH